MKRLKLILLITSLLSICFLGIFFTSCGNNGLKGDTGNGILKIEKTYTEELVDTYTITYTNGDTTTFTVTNGKNGIQGIQGEKGKDGLTPVITIGENGNWYINDVDTNKPSNIKGDTGNGISKIEKTNTEGLVDTYTITFTNGNTTTFIVTNGKDGIQGIEGSAGADGHSPIITIGENGNWFIDNVDTTKPSSVKGDTGNGISKIEKTLTEELVDTYTITYTNGETTTFTVTNGKDGIQGIEGSAGADGHSPVITIGENGNWFIDNVDTTKPSSIKGDTGNGISKIEKTDTDGLVDTYTITYTNGDTTTFTVTNGQNGIQGIQGPDGHTPVITIGDNGNWFIDGVDTTKPSSVKGDSGLSAYEIYLSYHPEYTGSEEDWINDLVNGRLNTIEYNVKFYNDGILYNEKVVNKGDLVTPPTNPTKTNYVFEGWYVSGTKWNFDIYTVNKDLELTANWIYNSFNLKTSSNNDNGTYTIVNDDFGLGDEIELEATPNTGYDFIGWFDENSNLISSSSSFTYVMKNQDINIVAYFREKQFQINYDVPAGTNINNPEYFNYFDTSITLNNPTLKGHLFAGWYSDSGYNTQITTLDNILDEQTIYGKFTPNTYTLTLKDVYHEFKVTFNYNYSGSTNKVVSVISGNAVKLPSTPTRSGYIFVGWYKEAACTHYFDFNVAITKNITVYAKWETATSGAHIFNMYSYNSSSKALHIAATFGYSSGAGHMNYDFVAHETGSHDIYIKVEHHGFFTLKDITLGTTIKEFDTKSTTYVKYTFNLTKGHHYNLYLCGTQGNTNDTYDDMYIYGIGFSNIPSTGIATSTFTSNVQYGAEISFPTQTRSGYEFLGWYDEDNNYYSSLTYDVDSNLTLYSKWTQTS